MTWRENIERVRDGLNLSDLRSRTDPIFYTASIAALDALTAQIEEIQRDSAYSALAATVLTAQIEELEQAVGDYMKQSSEQADEARKWRVRAEAAEQRVEELEAALRECIDWIDRPGYTEGDAATSSMARAALVQSDPPEDSE